MTEVSHLATGRWPLAPDFYFQSLLLSPQHSVPSPFILSSRLKEPVLKRSALKAKRSYLDLSPVLSTQSLFSLTPDTRHLKPYFKA